MKIKYFVYIFIVALEYLSSYANNEHCHKTNFQPFDEDYIYKDVDMCTMFIQSYSGSVNMNMSLVDYLLEYTPQVYIHDGHLHLLTEYEKNNTFILTSTVNHVVMESERHEKNKYDQFHDDDHAHIEDVDNEWQHLSMSWEQSPDKIVKDITNRFGITENCNSIVTFYVTFPSYPETDILSTFFKQFQYPLNKSFSSFSLNDKDNSPYRNNIHPSFLSFVDSLPLIVFRQLLRQYSNVRFIFCGHGLGGTVAQLSTLHLLSTDINLHDNQLRSISMGSLFFAGEETSKFIETHSLEKHFINIHHEMDLIPSLFNIQ
jgi:hypothetical protein